MPRGSVIPIAGTHRLRWPGTTPVAPVASGADVLLTAWLRPRQGGELDVDRARSLGATIPARRTYVDREMLARETTFDSNDLELLRKYCEGFGIKVLSTHWRSVVLSGGLDASIEAFGATVAMHETPDKRRFRHRHASLHAPPELAAILRAPLGLLEWPRSKRLGALHNKTTPLGAKDVAARYRFPEASGSGQSVAILQFRGTFRPEDFQACMRAQGVEAALPDVRRVDNAELSHRIETEKDIESAIDTQIVSALAPGARVIVYAAPDNERGVLDAIRTALFDESHPTILSISFGFPEYLWTPAALRILDELFTVAALTGVSVFCSSGDNGAELDAQGAPHVLAPASSSFVQACGGTEIADAASERGWAQSGGGFSSVFEVPPWQRVAAASAARHRVSAGRGVPDVAAQVVPGYTVFFNGEMFAMGGTSAVAPAWAALAARLNERLGCSIGFFAPLLYGNARASMLRDVTAGGNDRFACAEGWDPCSGLGVADGEAIERALRGS